MGRMVERAREIASSAHERQVDKSGRPYIEHPDRVAARVRGDEVLESIAWLHDVVEDTDVTLTSLEQSFPAEVTSAVDAVTKRSGESREDYYRRVRENPRALAVKLADIADNADPARLELLDEATARRLTEKYAAARKSLAGV